MAYKIQLRRDLAANWTGTNPVLAQGEPGVELDTKKMKVGDGVTAWNDLAYIASDSSGKDSTQNMFVKMSGLNNNLDPNYPGVISTSIDGLSWTPTVWNDQWTTAESWYVNTFAVGGGKIVYGTFEYQPDRQGVRWANNPFEKPTLATSDITRLGPNGETLNISNVRYLGGFFFAVGRYHDSVKNNFDYPFAVYSPDADVWSKIHIDLDYIKGLVDAENGGSGGSVGGIEIADVAYGDGGWLFGLHYVNDSTNINRNPTGAFYIKDLTQTLNGTNWISGIPGTYIAFFDGHGWVTWANYSSGAPNYNYPVFYFNSSSDPRQGNWRTVSLSDVSTSLIGRNAGCVNDVAAGVIDGVSWVVVADGENGAYATSDQGLTWRVIQTEPQHAYISYVSDGNAAYIDINGSYPYYNEKITITGSNIPQLNGVWYTDYDGNSPYLYHDEALTQPLDAGAWGDKNLYGYVTATGLYKEHTVSVNSTEGLVVGMAAYGNGPWTTIEDDQFVDDPNLITAIDSVKNTITMKYPFTDYFSGTIEFRPVLARSYGDGITDIAYGDGAFVGFAWNDSNRAYRTTDMTTWSHTSRARDSQNGPWDSGTPYSVQFGSVTIQNTMLTHDSRTVPGFTNFVSLTDTFQVNLVNADDPLVYSQLSYNFGYGGIKIDPSYGQWQMGAGFSDGPSSGIYTYESGNTSYPDNNDSHNSVAIFTWNNTFSFDDYDGYFFTPYIGAGDSGNYGNGGGKNGDHFIDHIHMYSSGSYNNIYIPRHEGLEISVDYGNGNTSNEYVRLTYDGYTNLWVDDSGAYAGANDYNWQFTDDCNDQNWGVLYQPDSALIQTAGYWKIGDYHNYNQQAYIQATDWSDNDPADILIHAGDGGSYNHQYVFDRYGMLDMETDGHIQSEGYWSLGDTQGNTSYTYIGATDNINGGDIYDVEIVANDTYFYFNHDGTIQFPTDGGVQGEGYWSIGDKKGNSSYTYIGATDNISGGDVYDIEIAANDTYFYFNNNGTIQLPVNGDIVDDSSQSVLRDMPQTLVTSGDYTIQLTDRGRHVYNTGTGNILIPTNASIAFPIGTVITLVTGNNAIHIQPVTGGTTILKLSKFGLNSNIAVSADTYVTILKVEADKWMIQVA